MKRGFVAATVSFLLLLCLVGCSGDVMPLSVEQARDKAHSCLDKHYTQMCDIAEQGSASGKAKWCEEYSALSDGGYEFLLYREWFSGTNICSGLLFLPNDTPSAEYVQDESDENVYVYAIGYADRYRLERLETNWFYFYYEYD